MKGVFAAWLSAAATVLGCGSSTSSGLLGGASCDGDADCSGGRVCRASACVFEVTDASLADVAMPGAGGAILPGGGGTFGSGGAAGSASGGFVSSGGAPREGGATSPGSEGVGCGPTLCAVGETCCFTPAGLFVQASYECVAGSCAGGAVPLACDGLEECSPGQVCCELTTTTILGGQTPVRTECADTCTGSDKFIVCRADSECSDGTSCLDSNLLPAFRVCR